MARKPKPADIYRIVNRVTGRQYIGISRDGYGSRWRNHRTTLRSGRHPSATMLADYRAHGFESFDVSLIEAVGDLTTLEAREWEIVSQALADGIVLYNDRRPVTCRLCGRRFMGKPERGTCSNPRC